MTTTLVIVLLMLILRADHVRSQDLRIGIIDFYGLHEVSESQARKALTVSEGDVITRVGDEPRSPKLKLHVPAAPFVDLLNSPVWTDRNEAPFALMRAA